MSVIPELSDLMTKLETQSQQIRSLEDSIATLSRAVDGKEHELCGLKAALKFAEPALQKANADVMHSESEHAALQQRVADEECSQRAEFLQLVDSERQATESTRASHVESVKFTTTMQRHNEAAIQARHSFKASLFDTE